MNKYQIAQRVYWIKYGYNIPSIITFEIGCIKEDKIGYKYSDGNPGSAYIQEKDLFLTESEAVEANCNRLRRLLDE